MPRKISTKEKIISETLKLAETMPWQKITKGDIAKAAKVNASIIEKYFSSKLLILDDFNRQLDKQLIKDFSGIDKSGSIREQLFEILMLRFDAMNKYKIALKSIYKGTIPFDPLASARGLKNLMNTMEVALNLIAIPTGTPTGCLKTKVLGAIFFRSFLTWLGDNSPDMANTMAKLDNDLAKAEEFSKKLFSPINA